MVDVKVKVSDEEKTLIKKFLHYDSDEGNQPLSLSHDDPSLSVMVQQALSEFKGTPTDVIVSIKYVW